MSNGNEDYTPRVSDRGNKGQSKRTKKGTSAGKWTRKKGKDKKGTIKEKGKKGTIKEKGKKGTIKEKGKKGTIKEKGKKGTVK